MANDVSRDAMQPNQRIIHAQFGYGRIEGSTGGDAVAVRFDNGLLASLRPAEFVTVPEADGELPKASG